MDSASNSTSEPPFPVRGIPGGYRDPWSDDDTDRVRQDVADADAHTADVAAEWKAEQQRARQRRERQRQATQTVTPT